MYGRLLIYLYSIANTFVFANLSVVPSQVLLPRTRVYNSPVTDKPLNFNVQVKLKTEHNKCVVWDLQDEGIFEIYEGDLDTKTGLPFHTSLSTGKDSCSFSVIVRPKSVPTVRSGQDNEALRTFIYGHDLATKSRTSAELSVSGLSFIAFETRNRRISIGQIVTLKVIGYDEDKNTFTSLEGIPFEVKVENSSVLAILGLDNDPQVSTVTRRAILDMPAHFPISNGYSVCTDVLVLKGASVGKTKLSLRVLLPEYKHVSIDDVEFIVSEHILVQPHRLLLAPGSSYKFCVSYLESAFSEGKKGVVDMKNYQWSTDVEIDGVKLSKDGLLTVSDGCPETLFRVVTKDVRTDETFSSLVSVNNPKSTGLYYTTYRKARTFFDELVRMGTDSVENEVSYLDALVVKLKESCLQNLRTGKLVKGGLGVLLYLLKGDKYLFDLSLFDATNSQFTSTGSSNFVWKMQGGDISILWKSKDERMLLLKALSEGTINVEVENKRGPTFACQLSITSSVTLKGFSEFTKGRNSTDAHPFHYSTRPLVLPLGESLRLHAEGGSGDYNFSVEKVLPEEPCVSLNNGVLHTVSYGTCILSIHDVNNEENLFKVQVIVTYVESAVFGESSLPLDRLYVEKGKQKFLPIRVKGDLSGHAPVYTTSWSDIDSLYYKFDSLDLLSNFVYNGCIEVGGFKAKEFFSHVVLNGTTVGTGILDLDVPVDATSLLPATLDGVENLEDGQVDAQERKTVHTRLHVQVYEPVSLQVDPFYRLPRAFTTNTLANVQVGGKVRVVVKGGHPKVASKTTLEHGTMLSVEALDGGVYDVYCLGESDGEVLQLVSSGQDSESTKMYTISCKVARNVKIYPAKALPDGPFADQLDLYLDVPDPSLSTNLTSGTPRGNMDVHGVSNENTQAPFTHHNGNYNDHYGDGTTHPTPHFTIYTNKDALHVFKAVVFDVNGVALVPSHNFTFSWTSFLSLDIPDGLTIDDSICTYKAEVPHTLVAHLEWKEVYDAKNTSAKVSGLLKVKKLTSLLQGWEKDPNKRYTHYLSDEVSITPKLSHSVQIYTPSLHICVFYNPNVLYRFMILGGSGDFTQVSTASDPIKFSYSPTFTLGVDDVQAPSDVYGKPVLDLFDYKDVQRMADAGNVLAKYVNFSSDYPAFKEIDISDKVILWQKSMRLSLQVAHVSKMVISLHDLENGQNGKPEVAENYTVFVGRRYVVTLQCFDASGVEVFGAVPTLTSSSASVVLDAHTLSTCLVTVAAPGTYNIKAEVGNYSGLSQVPNGPVATASITIEAHKEVVPLFETITVLPHSSNLELPFSDYNEALMVSATSVNPLVLRVDLMGPICKFNTLEPGTSHIELAIATGTGGSSSKSKYVIPVNVKMPQENVELKTKTSVLTVGSSAYVYVDMDTFTPFYLAMDKRCTYEWTLEGPGHFVESGDKTVQRPGLTAVSLFGDKEGTLFVSAKVMCRVKGDKFEAVTQKTVIECQKRADPFTNISACPIIMAQDSIYASNWDILDITGTDGVMSMVSRDMIKTQKSGDVLVKSARGSHHVRVDQIASILLQDGDMVVKRGGREDFKILLKDKSGCPILSPLDVSFQTFSSDSNILRITALGDTVTVLGISDGSALVALRFGHDGTVESFFEVHVKNSVIPQSVHVVKGSNVYHISKNTKKFLVRLNFGLASLWFGLQDYDSTFSLVAQELYKVVQTAGGHVEAIQDPIVEAVAMDGGHNDNYGDHNGSRDTDHNDLHRSHYGNSRETILPKRSHARPSYASTRPSSLWSDVRSAHPLGGGFALLTIPLVCGYKGDVEEFLRATNEALVLQNTSSILSTLESGLLPQSDDVWVSDSPSVFSAGSPGTAISEGTSVVGLDKGKGYVTVVASVSKVEFSLASKETGPLHFGPLKCVDMHNLYTIVAKVYSVVGSTQNVVESTNFVSSNLFCLCRFMDDVHAQIFTFLPSQHMVGHSFYPSANLTFNVPKNWEDFAAFLKTADVKVGTNLHLAISLHTSKRKDGVWHLDAPLWSSKVEWKAPQIVKFVDAAGTEIKKVCQDNLGASIHVYPFYGRYSLHSESKHYSLRILERSGLLCTFSIANNGFNEDTQLVVKNGKQVIGILKIEECVKALEQPVREIIIERTRYKSDLFSFLTVVLVTLLIYLLYSLAYRNERYYEPTVPIQVERKLPNVFEKIYKGEYENIANGTTHRKLYA